jgi:hypothetical protein
MTLMSKFIKNLLRSTIILSSLLIGMTYSNLGVAAESVSEYEATVAGWKSYEDVAGWLKSNFVFDKDRQQQVVT